MYKAFEEILEQMDNLSNRLLGEAGDIGCTIGIINAIERSKDIVYEIATEYDFLDNPSCQLNDTVYELCECDDGVNRIFPMQVKAVRPYGAVRWIEGKEPTTWNIYAEGEGTYMYKNYYDLGKTLFLSEEAAQGRLKEIETSLEEDILIE